MTDRPDPGPRPGPSAQSPAPRSIGITILVIVMVLACIVALIATSLYLVGTNVSGVFPTPGP